jgi:hypothetical protein
MGRSHEVHGMSYSATYQAWKNMLQRCTNPNAIEYKNYGARGIKVCTAWATSFDTFHKDMGDKPASLSLDRIDNDGDYTPANCRWTDGSTQNYNRREATKPRSDSTTKVTGVSYHKLTGKYAARVYRNGLEKHLGLFDTIEEAAQAREQDKVR